MRKRGGLVDASFRVWRRPHVAAMIVPWSCCASTAVSSSTNGVTEANMREDQAAAVTRTRRRTPLGIQVLAGLSGLLALLLVSMLVAIVLVVVLRRDQTALTDRGV